MSGSTHSADTSTGGGWIDMSRGAMQQALEALKRATPTDVNEAVEQVKAIEALRAAMAEEVSKETTAQPVAWAYKGEPFFDGDRWHDQYGVTTDERVAKFRDKDATPLYTAPPAPVVPQPVAEVVEDHFSKQVVGIGKWASLPNGTKLYTTPPAPVAPPGWRMVPVEPTQEMVEAGYTATITGTVCGQWAAMLAAAPGAPAPVVPQPLTEREVELIDGMIEVQLRHAAQCDLMLARAGGNHTMAVRQKGWDMERVELLRKIRGMGEQR